MPLFLEVVTPERKVLAVSVDHVALPTAGAGEIDILPGHIPLMTLIEPGELRYHSGGEDHSIAIDRGFIEIKGDTVCVLTESAVEVERLDPEAAAKAMLRAAEAVEEARERGEEAEILEQLETKARFALVQKLLAEKKR